MTVAAVMLVKDEEDIIEYTVRHLLGEVDHVLVFDNGSTDATRDLLIRVGSEPQADRGTLDIWDDPEPGYFQDQKMTAFARHAYAEYEVDWIVPVDADEYWYSPFGRIADVLACLGDEVQFVNAPLFNHIGTPEDPTPAREPNPFRRFRWRLVEENPLVKVACRASATLRIGMGNHEAWADGTIHSLRSNVVSGDESPLKIRHFPWRTEQQFLRKIANGARAYAATNIDATYGAHWRSFGMPEDEGFEGQVIKWFRDWGFRLYPYDAEHSGGPVMIDPCPMQEDD